ncbi:hypothetical protein CASFOL_039456 [Castilleja foliolosa]|uniref:Uncharacterized protein n=1 Tax=Castilleja foliolosa TaxID=1961234 RepID=A0ABD3BIH7_9LAMI
MSFIFKPFCLCSSLLILLLASSSSHKLASAEIETHCPCPCPSPCPSPCPCPSPSNKSAVSAVLIFGDSTVDSGNNNDIPTYFKSNFPPYGQDFAHHVPTGRFCNGRLPNDFIANYLGVKEFVPAYLNLKHTTEELKTGVSFASAGSGYDPLTPTISSVIPLEEQLIFLKMYRKRLDKAIGIDKTKEIINNALFVLSAGTNDFVVNYFAHTVRHVEFTIPAYMDFLLKQTCQFLEGLVHQGARRIAVAGLPPMGCLPIVITMHADDPIVNRKCVHEYSCVARDYNQLLQKELKNMEHKFQAKGVRIGYLNIYTPLEDMILGHKYGFEEVSNGCCGTGTVEMSYLCHPHKKVCKDASKYVFFDSIHPTEKAYEILFQSNRPTLDTLVKE